MEKETSVKVCILSYVTLFCIVCMVIIRTACPGEMFSHTILGQLVPAQSYVEMDSKGELAASFLRAQLGQISGLYSYLQEKKSVHRITSDPIVDKLDDIKLDKIGYIINVKNRIKEDDINLFIYRNNPIYINKNKIENNNNAIDILSRNTDGMNFCNNKIVNITQDKNNKNKGNINTDENRQNEKEEVDINSDKMVDINQEMSEENDTEQGVRKELVLLKESRFASNDERIAYYESLKDFEFLKKSFYQIDRSTYIDESELDASQLFSMDMTVDKNSQGPQILIYHTHSQEAFVDSRPGRKEDTVVGAGEYLAGCLREYGFDVMHHEGEYDVKNRDFAYSTAAPALEKILQENPSIQVIIDLHRDGVEEQTRLVGKVNGVDCAQFMFFNGLSRTNATGEIDYLNNPFRGQNLAMSFQLQLKADEYYPEVIRKIYLKGYRYNMQYRGKSILVEVGAQTNTVEEIMNSMPIIARILAMVLQGESS